MNARRVVVILVAALVVYFVLIGIRGVYLVSQDSWTLRVLGIAVFVLPLIGIWVVVAELRFGRATQRLAESLDPGVEAFDPTVPELPRLPSGRPDRDAADALFLRRKAEVEADPDSWQGWYRLGVSYDLAGDRRRARAAMREAIRRSG